MDFRCGAGSNQSENNVPFFPCQHGGVCVQTLLRGQSCLVCEDGWEHDLYGFAHFYNCAIPSWAPLTFLIAHTVVVTIGLSIVASLFARGEVRRGKTRTVTLLASACATLAWLSVLSAYLQGGLYEGSLTSLMLLGALGLSMSPFIIPALLYPVASLTSSLPTLKRVTAAFRVVSGLQIVLLAVLLCTAMARCRDEDKRTFNLVTVIALWEVVIAVGLQAIITLAVCHRLGLFFVDHDKRAASSNNQSPDLGVSPTPLSPFTQMGSVSEQRHRLILSQLCVIATFCGIAVAVAIIMSVPLILWTVHHSLPYMWIFHLAAFPLVALTFPLIVPFVRGSANARQNRTGLSSSGERHFLSENADVIEDNGIRTLGIKKSKRNQLWRIKLANVLSRISEESQVESRKRTLISKLSLSEHQE